MTLSDARKEIDKIDGELLSLLLRRLTLSRRVGEIKRQNNTSIEDKVREEEIFNRLKLTSCDEYKYIEPIFREILTSSKAVQK